MADFMRLGVLGDGTDPYATMDVRATRPMNSARWARS
jgi:isoleucyl-tRNA synthetase